MNKSTAFNLKFAIRNLQLAISPLWVCAALVLISVLSGCQTNRLDRVLVFSKTSWYRHEATPQVNEFLARIGREQGCAVDATEDAGAFTDDNLGRYDVVIFNNTTDIGKALDDAQKQAFIDWFRAGGGYVGL